MRTKILIISILWIATIAGTIYLTNKSKPIQESTIEIDTIFIEKKFIDTVLIANYDTITKTITQYLKPETIIKLDTYFMFNEMSTYIDSIVDSYFVFKYHLSVIGQPMNLEYDMRTFYPVITKTVTNTIEYNSIFLNLYAGNSVMISAGFNQKGKKIIYSGAYDPILKTYLLGLGYSLRW